MKRSPLKRKTPLARGTSQLKRSRLKPRNPDRAAAERLRDFGPQAEWMRDLPCSTCGARPPSVPSHVGRSRGAGGTRDDLAPQCSACHEAVHRGRLTFERERGVDLAELAREYARRWLELPEIDRERYVILFRQRWLAAGRLLDSGS
jgi:hypothetical protein